MNIFYTDEAGNVVGPIDRDDLQYLVDANRLPATTQVCREGSEHWRCIPELNVYYTDQTGSVLGPVTRSHLQELVDADQLPITTRVCHEGSERWQPISACFRRSTKEGIDPVTAVPGTQRSWRGEPATEKQLDYLRSLGCEIRGGLTKGEAAEMIDAIPEDERGVKQIEFAEKERNLYCTWVLHRNVLSAKRELGDAEKADVHDAQESLREALNIRVRFWQDVFNDGMEWADESISDQLVEFADQFRDIFAKPSRKVVQEILDSLDAQSAEWDRETPEMFFDALGWKYGQL